MQGVPEIKSHLSLHKKVCHGLVAHLFFNLDSFFSINPKIQHKSHFGKASLTTPNEESRDHPDAYFNVYEITVKCNRLEFKSRWSLVPTTDSLSPYRDAKATF